MEETKIILEVPAGYREGERLDVYVTGFIQNATRAKVQKGIKEGRVLVNGEPALKPSTVVQAGDVLQCTLLRPPPLEIVPEPMDLDIIHEDDVLLVVNKPAGVVVHPAYGHRSGTLLHGLLHHLGSGTFSVTEGDEDDDITVDEDESLSLSTVNAAPRYDGDVALRPGIVHRLDKDTSGLLVIAKNDVAHAHLAAQFAERTIRRHYEALVWGHPDREGGTADTWLARDPRDRRRMAVSREGHGKHAITHFDVLEYFVDTTLVAFRLETGRTHQIRVHAEHMGHHVFGDKTYGGDRIQHGRTDGTRKVFYQNLFKLLPRQALHAASIGFRHPSTGQEVYFEAPQPPDMTAVVERVRANLKNVPVSDG